jgi:hypothetical protein
LLSIDVADESELPRRRCRETATHIRQHSRAQWLRLRASGFSLHRSGFRELAGPDPAASPPCGCVSDVTPFRRAETLV